MIADPLPDGLSLVLDEDLVHADLVGEEPALSAGGGQLEVGVDGAGGADHLGRDGVLVEVALEHVDLEGTLFADPHLGGGAADLERLRGRRLPLDPLGGDSIGKFLLEKQIEIPF